MTDIVVKRKFVRGIGPAGAILLGHIYARCYVGGHITATQKELAEQVGLSVSQVGHSLRQMLDLGLIERDGRKYTCNITAIAYYIPESPTGDKKPKEPSPAERLINGFVEEVNTRLPQGSKNIALPQNSRSAAVQWWKPMSHILHSVCDGDEQLARQLISHTVNLMVTQKLTIKSVRSIVRVAEMQVGNLEDDSEWTPLGQNKAAGESWTPL